MKPICKHHAAEGRTLRRLRADRRQIGASAIGLIFMLIVAACVLLLGMKLFPVYMESIKTDQALRGTIEDPAVGKLSKKEIAYSVVRRLDIDGETRIREQNYKEYLTIKKQRDRVSIDVKWRAETPIFANLSIVADFEKQVQNY
ncbi:MAG: DUF4845 domain-containing protein [Gammaproteobacteria bacterium]|nr:DUF4845 domain-containing protein [Gammaproteobacteria bacterium]